MDIELKQISVSDLVKDYEDNQEGGVVGYAGRLDIRPPFQREFVYKDKQRDAVIDSLTKEYPLNVMYWSVRDDEAFEVIDGQQRTISICEYVEGAFAFEKRYFHNLQKDEQDQILDYKLMVYLCSGTDRERLEWFKTINIAGMELTNQELRNAVYAGSWLSDAKRYFSRNGCPAYEMAGNLLKGNAIRQDYLETVIKWISDGDIEAYMAKQQHKPDSNDVWLYFQRVVGWVKATFPTYRSEMKSIEWGELYNEYGDAELNRDELEERIAVLMVDEDVTKKRGIYRFVLDGQERHLSIRAFTGNQKREAYERQNGICPVCGEHFEIGQMEADHITPWHSGGRTVAENCRMLCKDDNRKKSSV